MNCEPKNPEIQQPESKEVCRNCGAELHGQYCHECGQKFSRTEYTMKGFVLEYLKNAYKGLKANNVEEVQWWLGDLFITLCENKEIIDELLDEE